MLNDLKALAAETAPEKRQELLMKLTDLYVGGASYSDTEALLFADVMGRIIDSVAIDCRIEMARHLAGLHRAPREVAVKLARDADIAIAGPVLEQSSALTEDDLVDLASSAPQSHLTAIAHRSEVPERVTDVLVDRGDREVIHTVSANVGARFSEGGMGRLIDRARADPDLQVLLVDRADLTPSAIGKLLPLVGEAVLGRLAELGFDIGRLVPVTMQEIMKKALTSGFAGRRLEARRLTYLAGQIRDGGLALDKALEDLLDDDHLLDGATLIADVAGLDRDMIFGVIAKGDSANVTLLFRALDLPFPLLDRFLALRAEKGLMPHDPAADGEARFAAIEPAMARRVIRFLKLRRQHEMQRAAG